MDPLTQQLMRHEGFRAHPYLCSAGKLTIGYGRNIEDNGIAKREALYLLANDISKIRAELLERAAWFCGLDPVRADAIINMSFMGVSKTLRFKRMIACIERRDWAGAAREMIDSKWATQVGSRATELARQMATGERS